MHPVAAYAVLKGCYLLSFRDGPYRIMARMNSGVEALYAPTPFCKKWTFLPLAGILEYEETSWDDVPVEMLDKLTPELIDQLMIE